MSQVLNSLIISKGSDAQRQLEAIMQDNLEGYILSFMTAAPEMLENLDREPDLIFIDNVEGLLKRQDIEAIARRYARKTCVMVDADNSSDEDRRQLIKAGLDEIMSFSELKSDIGKYMLEKLIAFKRLADAETRIEQSEERFKAIIENSHDIIVLLDADGTILYTSPALGRQMMYAEWEILGQRLSDFMHDEDRIGFDYHLSQVVADASQGGKPIEFQFRSNTGEWRSLEAYAANLINNETVNAIVLNIRDMTEQRETERELEKYRLHLEALVDKRTREVEDAHAQANAVVAASPDALIAVDPDGYIQFISEHYRLIYPNSADILVPGRHIMEAFEAVTRELRLSPMDPRYDEMKEWWQKPKGSKEFRMQNRTWVRLQAKRMKEGKGIVISSTNISDYKRQQAQLAAQSAELGMALATEKKIVEQQKTFVTMVSHEFRTPLTIIDGNAQIIEARGDRIGHEILVKRAGNIRAGVERLVRLIETVLSAHVMDSGKLTINPAPCDPGTIIRSAVSEHKEISTGRNIQIKIGDLPRQMMLDEKIFRQMMGNLLSNAIKYSATGSLIEVHANEQSGRAIIEVRDEGVGIPESEIPRIFTKYFRASTSSGVSGSGIGLNLVKQFVELHGGEISLKSKVGVGTTVSIVLPIARA